MKRINPLRLAEKLHHWDREDRWTSICERMPRLRELLWSLHWQSCQPGGIDRFVERFIEAHPPKFGSGGAWTLEQCLPIWEAERSRCAHHGGAGFGEFACWAVDKEFEEDFTRRPTSPLCDRDAADLANGVERFNRSYFAQCYANEARSRLPGLLVDICERLDADYFAPSYHPDLYPALCAFMDRHAELTRQTIASTRVAEMVFKRLDFAHTAHVPALILGDARIGKTKSVATWAAMYPGLARVVTTPSDDTMTAFYYAHADALGLDYTPSTSTKALKFDLEFIIANSGLLFLYDESHYLVPQNYTSKTPPARMNWVRSCVIDRGIGVAFFSTRQSYEISVRKYWKKTQYQFEQWLGRIAPPLILPDKLDSSELLASARANFPALDSDLLEIVVERCIVRGTGLQELGGAVRYAEFLAKRAGRTEPSLEDIDGAFEEYLLEREEKTDKAPRSPREASAPLAPDCRATQPISDADQPVTRRHESEVSLV